MACRGPDGVGSWSSTDGRVGLAHRRLSIIDLSDRAAQPMLRESGTPVISFNGEIYNYRELRRALETKGYSFSTESDTEVLLQLYAAKGEAMVHDLGGMFAFAIWDEADQSMFLARDPFGIKPLYYSDDGRRFQAASEVKALRAGGQVNTSADAAGHVGFFLWGSVPEPFTLYQGVRALPAGCIMRVTAAHGAVIKRYAEVTSMLANAERSSPFDQAGVPEAQLRDAVRESVQRHLVADVDVGVFLSAGVDSATLAAVATELGGALRTVTLGFEEFRGKPEDETPLAATVARQYGSRHSTVWITRDDFVKERDHLIDRMDQPTIDGVNTFFVARAAASTGLKVAMSGLGGDELFGGYSSFRQLPRLVGALGRVPFARVLGRGLRRLSAPLLSRTTSPKYASVLEFGGGWGSAYLLRRGLFMPWELHRVLDRDLVRAGLRELAAESRLGETVGEIRSPRFKVSALEASWYMRNQLLRDTDWASMSSSLEVRVPFVDWTFWGKMTRLVAGGATMDKRMLSRVPATPLPPAITTRPKTGFGIPVQDWLLRDMDGRKRERGLRGWARFVYDRAAA